MRSALRILRLLLCLALQLQFISGITRKTCVGINFRSHISFHQLESRYADCTHIVGNLEMHNVDSSLLQDKNLNFLENIEEITGHIVINGGKLGRTSFKSLRIIRGETLFRLSSGDPGYAILIGRGDYEHVEFPALKEISNGSVGIFSKEQLCYLETLNWKDILNAEDGWFIYHVKRNDRRCGQCDPYCENGCWGEGPDKCQTLSKLNCNPGCGGARCFGTGEEDCCHHSCTGGCTGPARKDCLSCRGVNIDGECREKCPSGKYKLGTECVDICPEESLVHEEDTSCLAYCPENKHERNRKCRRLYPPAKKCRSPSDMWPNIHSGNIEELRNCTIIDRDIWIDGLTFTGRYNFPTNFTYSAYQRPLDVSALEIFSTVREINGVVVISGAQGVQNLSWLRNLEMVGHKDRLNIDPTDIFSVKYTSAKSLNLHSLKEVHGGVVIKYNSDLCYVDSINWSRIVGGNEVSIHNNCSPARCEWKGSVCSAECSGRGCWGPNSNDCDCSDYRLEGKCVPNCEILPGYSSDGHRCVGNCPTEKFKEEGECKECHDSCDGGCNGPSNELGETGCRSCHHAILYRNGTMTCKENCPAGFYSETVSLTAHGELQPIAGKVLCRKCHPLCSACTGEGTSKEECQECAYNKTDDGCEAPSEGVYNLTNSASDKYDSNYSQNGSVGMTFLVIFLLILIALIILGAVYFYYRWKGSNTSNILPRRTTRGFERFQEAHFGSETVELFPEVNDGSSART